MRRPFKSSLKKEENISSVDTDINKAPKTRRIGNDTEYVGRINERKVKYFPFVYQPGEDIEEIFYVKITALGKQKIKKNDKGKSDVIEKIDQSVDVEITTNKLMLKISSEKPETIPIFLDKTDNSDDLYRYTGLEEQSFGNNEFMNEQKALIERIIKGQLGLEKSFLLCNDKELESLRESLIVVYEINVCKEKSSPWHITTLVVYPAVAIFLMILYFLMSYYKPLQKLMTRIRKFFSR